MKSLNTIVLFFASLSVGSFAQGQQSVVISNGTLIDGTGKQPLANSVIVIRGERIVQVGTSATVPIPQDARIIDATGKFVLPGLIDTHVHLEMIGLSDLGDLPSSWSTPGKLRELVALNAQLDFLAGITTVRDLGSTPAVLDIRDSIQTGRLVGPRIVAAGMQLAKKSADAEPEPTFLEYDGVDDARAKAQQLLSLGVNVFKIRLTRMRPIPSLAEVQAIVGEAHHAGLRATVHTDVPADELVKLAIDAGADGIEHNAPLRTKDEGILSLLAKKKMFLMAGAGHFYVQRIDSMGLVDSLDAPQTRLLPPDLLQALRKGLDSLHRQTGRMKKSGWSAALRQASFITEIERARKAGVLLTFGTDCGAYGMIHGEQYKAIYGDSMMGSSAMQAILMATRDAATALGKPNDLGTVEVGKLGDVIIIDKNPLLDLRNLRLVNRIVKSGVVCDPAELVLRGK